MESIRIVFMGTPAFAAGILETLLENKANVVAVVTQPDKAVGRKRELQPTPVKQVAINHRIPVLQPLKIKEDYEAILATQPDLIVTCAYGQIVPKVVLDAPKYSCVNIHASLLPKYRGGAPIHYAVLNGDEKTGITFMKMAPKMDAGELYVQKEFDIEPDVTTSKLFDQLMKLAQDMLMESLQGIIDGTYPPIPQDESQVSYAYNITPEQEKIDFHQDSQIVYNHIRGLLSWPSCYALLNGKKVKFHAARHVPGKTVGKCGEILGLEDGGLAVACQTGKILLDVLQTEGKGKVSAKDFYNGNKDKIGLCFE